MATTMAMNQKTLTVLGIETSCDETAAAVVRGRPGQVPEILSDVLFSQLEEHAPYGGVVPEIAARSHITHLDGLIADALTSANTRLSDLDGIAATAGPGLIGGVIVGLMAAKGLAHASDKPLIAVNHLEGHALSIGLSAPLPFPYLLALISGGHCQLLAVEGVGKYRLYGTTIDDAVGEAFDKTAKLLSLSYPGGPAIEKAAQQGDPNRFKFPRPLAGRDGCDFSFSGLKTAVLHGARELGQEKLGIQDTADIAASFQAAVADVMADRTTNAFARFQADFPNSARSLVVAGGVAANTKIRERLTALCDDNGFSFVAPPLKHCTDNAAMIAWAGIARLAQGLTDPLSFSPLARWPLDPEAA